MERKLDTSVNAGGTVATERARFDQHMDTCPDCQSLGMCSDADSLWRGLVLAALAAHNRNGGA